MPTKNLVTSITAHEMKNATTSGVARFSYSQIERTLKRECGVNPKIMEKARKNGKMFRADVREMSDDEILSRLAGMGFNTNKNNIRKIAAQNRSAEEASKRIIADSGLVLSDNDEDFLWLGITVLWERWAPDFQSFEMLDDSIQLGYKLDDEYSDFGISEWMRTWEMYKVLAEKWDLRTDKGFDAEFNGTQYVSNWIQDFAHVFEDAARYNKDFLMKGAIIKNEILETGMVENEHTKKNFRGSAAELLIRAGAVEAGDKVFEEVIKDDPYFVYYYVWWADAYYFYINDDLKDYEKALAIIKRGLNVCGSADDDILLDRLEDLTEEMGIDSKEVLAEIGLKPEDPDDEIIDVFEMHAKKEKIGRNASCPCGSGKKYKKCCGSGEGIKQ